MTAALDPEVREERLIALYAPDVPPWPTRLEEFDLNRWPNFAYLAGGETRRTLVLADPTTVAGILAQPATGTVPQVPWTMAAAPATARLLEVTGGMYEMPECHGI